jgi:dUTP pyrophosphatase
MEMSSGDETLPPGSALDRESIRKRLQPLAPLVEGYLSLETQLQPNGFDLSLSSIAVFENLATASGVLTTDDSGRRLAKTSPLEYGTGGSIHLDPGCYLTIFNEVVHLPLDLMALGRPRSSLLRSGVALHTAVWDAGYSGRSQALLVVYHPQGFTLSHNARLMQLVFFRLEKPLVKGYAGQYQGEGLAQKIID